MVKSVESEITSTSRAGSFETFFREHYRPVLGAVYMLTGNVSEAEDLTQEAFARAFEQWTRVQEMASPAGYIFRTAANLQKKRLRHLLVVRKKAARASQQPDHLTAAELRVDIGTVLRQLRSPYPEVLLMIEWLGMSTADVAGLLSIEPSSVRSILSRGNAKVREAFGGYQ